MILYFIILYHQSTYRIVVNNQLLKGSRLQALKSVVKTFK